MNEANDNNSPLSDAARAWLHDAAGVCANLELLASTAAETMPPLIDAYRAAPNSTEPLPDPYLQQLGQLDQQLRKLAAKLRNANDRTLAALGKTTDIPNTPQQAATPTDPSSTAGTVEPPTIPDATRPKALVADDEVLMREVLADMLEARGYQVERAQHGGEAWKMSEQTHYDLVLLDFRMPVMHGFEVTQRIKSQPQDRQPDRLIGMTVSPLAEEHEQGRSIGMDAVLIKPVNGEALDAVLQKTTT